MADTANVVLVMGFVRNEDKLSAKPDLLRVYGKRRKFYSCNNGSMDNLRYVDEGTRGTSSLIEQDYIGYSGNYEKSSGVFNQNGLLSKKERTELRNNLRTTQSTIWHGIISFEESFGKRYCNSYEQAQRLMAMELPKFFKSAGFDKDKIVWYAGLHENTDHRHIHFSFYESEPSTYRSNAKGLTYSNGKIDKKHFDKFKISIEQRLTDITSEIKIARNDVTDLTRSLLFSNPNRNMHYDNLQRQLQNLAQNLPVEGRLSYDSQNMLSLKPVIKDIVNNVIKSNKSLYSKFEYFCAQVRDRDNNTLEILKSNKVKASECMQYLTADKYLEDIYRRLGNQIITAVRVIRGRERKAKRRLAVKHIRRKTVASLIEYSLRLDSAIESEADEAFRELLEKLEENKENITGEQSELE